MNTELKKELQNFATQIRIGCCKEIKARGFGHLSGSLSIADALAVLYGKEMKYDPKNPRWEDRDWFVLSKGHAGPALYATLALKGFFDENELLTLNRPGTILPSHPDRNKTPGVDISTGSLGQGISLAMGVATGLKAQGKPNRVYCIVGDGESNEGQVWEAILYANQRKLDNVVVLYDYNKKQLDGYTKDVCDMGDVKAKFESFGWNTYEIDGHDIEAIDDALQKAKQVKGKPTAIVMNTIKGKGVTYLEEMMMNHHINVTDEQMDGAIAELTAKLV